MNRVGFAKIKNRMEYFYLIGHLMEHGDVFRFYPERAENTRIQATFLIHEKERDLYLHLFLVRESPKSNYYSDYWQKMAVYGLPWMIMKHII